MQGKPFMPTVSIWAARLALACLLGFTTMTTNACSLFVGVEQEGTGLETPEGPGDGDGGEDSAEGGEGLGSGESDEDAEAEADEAVEREGAGKSGDGPATKPELDEEALGNMTYIYNDQPVTLSNGVYQETVDETSASFITNLSLYHSTFGDLNGDGMDDAAAMLLDSPGGSGSFLYLYGVLDQGSALTSTAGVMLGDRYKIEDFRIENGQVMIEVIRHGPDDPMCCPSEEATLLYIVQNGRMVEIATE